jgi:arabinogalactan oligomer/maltooligosaccharide transport system substrate-binding protein
MFGLPDAHYNACTVYGSFGRAVFGKKADRRLDGGQIVMDEPGFIAALEFLSVQARKKLIPETVDWDAAHALFESGKAPFALTGPWALGRFKTAGVPYAIGAFPAAKKGGAPGNPFLGVQGMIVSAASKRKLAAQSFAVDFIATEENMLSLFNAEQRPSAWKTIFDHAGDSDTKGFNAAGANAVPMPSIPEMGYVWDAWTAAAALAFSGEKTPAEALKNARVQIESLITSK